jgi:DNA mismatch repair protein MutL
MGERMTESFDTQTQPAIRRLPAEVIGRIAAGEMITRPSAAVKELIENALDAGAQRITVRVTESLDRRLEIADDGCGIPAADLALALERYTTSKLRRGGSARG